MGDIRLFQMDLQNGMKLEDALIKHELDLPTAFELVDKPLTVKKQPYRRSKNKTANSYAGLYIQKHGNKFYVRKQIRGKTRMFGSYSSLEDAIAVRDKMIEIGWERKSVDRVCDELGIERNKKYCFSSKI